MKKKLQKVFAMVLALSMVMSLMSVTAFAEGETSWTPVGAESGIKFQLFDYDENINKNGLSGHFDFRGSCKDNPDAVSVIGAYDKDGYVQNRVNVESRLSNNGEGYPVIDLTRAENAIAEAQDVIDNPDSTAEEKAAAVKTKEALALPEKASLGYLFGAGGTGVTAYKEITNTPLRQAADGTYYYSSKNNAVDFDIATKTFTVLDATERGSSTASTGENCNDFLPFTNGKSRTSEYSSTTDYDYVSSGEGAEINYWFGMTMEFDFWMPEGGQLNGKDMVFNFSGDDDVWVFIDGDLALDLGGTHGVATGSINFASGDVVQYLDWKEADENTAATRYDSSIGQLTPNEKHTLKFFYLERGAGTANCSMSFNMPVLPAGTVSVRKEVAGDINNIYKDQAYTFVMKKADGTVLLDEPYTIDDPTSDDVKHTDPTTGEFTLTANQTAFFSDFTSQEEGQYYFAELQIPGNVNSVSSTVNGKNAKANSAETSMFTVDPSGTNSVVITNTMKNAKFSFLKTDSGKNNEGGVPAPLQNASFTLSSDSFETTETSGADGVVKFEGIPFGTYTLTEIGAPSGYEADPNASWTVKVEYDDGVKVSLDDHKANANGEIVVVSTVDVDGVPTEQETPFAITNKALNSLTIKKTVVVDTTDFEAVGNRTQPNPLEFDTNSFEFSVLNSNDFPVATRVKLDSLAVVPEKCSEDGKIVVWEGTATVTGLPADTYTVVETSGAAVANSDYEWEVSYQNNGAELEDGAADTIGVTNTYTHVPNCFRVEVKKEWKDDNNRDGKRPDSLTVGLFIDDASEPIKTAVLNDANGWTYTFKYDCVLNDGARTVCEIGYTIGEKTFVGSVSGYTLEGGAPVVTPKNDTSEKVVMTNVHEPELVDIAVRKVWAESALGRERQVTVWLKADGEKVRNSERNLSAENSWYTVYEDLFKYENGAEIVYEVTENKIGNNWSASVDETTEEYFISLFTEVHTEESARAYLAANTADWETMNADAQQGLIAQLVGQPLVDTSVFDNDDMVHVVVTNSYGGGYNPPPTKEEPKDPPKEEPTVIEDEDPPLAMLPDEDVPLAALPEDIFDEEVPLAMAPATGDVSALWLALSALSGTGLAGVSFLNRKKRDEE